MTYVPAQYAGWVQTAAKGTGLSESVVAAQINEESGFNPGATSPAGAQGIAQFEPGTWAGLGCAGSAYDAQASLVCYIKLMSELLAQFGGSVRNALAAYNAGPGNIAAGFGYADTILSNAGQGVNYSVSTPTPGSTTAPASYGAAAPNANTGYDLVISADWAEAEVLDFRDARARAQIGYDHSQQAVADILSTARFAP